MTRWAKPIVAIGLFLYMVTQILSFRLAEKRNPSAVERFIVFVNAPVQSALTKSIDWIGGVWNHYVGLSSTSRTNEQLVKEIQQLREKLARSAEESEENKRLRALLELKERFPLELLAAERIAVGASPFERTIRIRRGSADGVKPEMAVIHPLGAVGQVIPNEKSTDAHVADVLLIMDLNSYVDGMSQRSRARGIARGAGMHELRLDYLSKNDDIQPGDEIVTTGLDGIFPKGIPIGTVIRVVKDSRGLFNSAVLKPFVDASRIEEVAVVLKDRK